MRQKVGVVSCSGECCSLGILSRVATRLVLEEGGRVTICLPLFLAGDSSEREFARLHPTVAVDGCGKHCAKKGIERYSAPVAGSVDVEALLAEWGVEAPKGRRELDPEGLGLARRVADSIRGEVRRVEACSD